MISAQNTALPTASLSATERLTTKTIMVDGEWVSVPVIIGEREGQCRTERPADGSANLLEAVRRARAYDAYRRFMTNAQEAINERAR